MNGDSMPQQNASATQENASTAPVALPSAAPQVPPPLPVASAMAMMKPEPLGDHDTSILSHLGLPFYYRHAPNRGAARGAIWIAFFATLLVVMLNVMQMPYDKDTFIYQLRTFAFGSSHAYTSFEEGARWTFYYLYIIAIIVSGIIAPLYSTYSYSSERVMGTLEFLRLSPMSTLSIVMGKMFAPVFVLHLISLMLLLLGGVFGLCGGFAASSILFAALVIFTTSAIFHAIGALLASLSVAFRGFFAVGALCVIGWMVSTVPATAAIHPSTAFLSYFSPWGPMASLFWGRGFDSQGFLRSPSVGIGLFCGKESLVLPYTVAAHALAFVLLVWAASRKLEHPERRALPLRGWIVLWLAVLGTALGVVDNFSAEQARWGSSRNWGWGWQFAAVTFMLGGIGVCVLALLDHPHERELVLTEECEFAAGREKASGASAWRMLHALFCAGVTLVSVLVLCAMLNRVQSLRSTPEISWNEVAAIAGISSILAFLFSIALECAWVRFSAFWVRCGAAFVCIGALLFAVFVPIGRTGVMMWHWNQVLYSVEADYARQAGQKSGVNKITRGVPDLNWVKANPDRAIYLEGTESAEALARTRAAYKDNPVAFLWHYHPSSLATYLLVFSALALALFILRSWTYRALRREAIRAVRPPPRITAATASAALT